MDHFAVRNRAVLVSVTHFDNGVNLGKRTGAARDVKRLHRSLSKLGFNVDIHNDLSSEEIYSLFKKVSRQPVKDCILVVLSSHGEEGCVFGADGNPVRLSHIFTCFSNVHMEGKTKLFFIQACRGGRGGMSLDDGVEVDATGSDVMEDSISQYLSVPVDTAVIYATTPGYGAFMHPAGAVFLQTLCDLIEDEDSHGLELTRVLTRLSHRVAYTFQVKSGVLQGKKEMPCFLTRMTRETFPFFTQPMESG